MRPLCLITLFFVREGFRNVLLVGLPMMFLPTFSDNPDNINQGTSGTDVNGRLYFYHTQKLIFRKAEQYKDSSFASLKS